MGTVISVFAYLYLVNGFDLIGEYSALTSIMAPIVTFSLYKYLELMNITHKDKKFFFVSEVLPSTIITFVCGGVLVQFLNIFLKIFDPYVFLIFFLVKYLDLRFELVVGYFSSYKNYKYVLKQNIFRISFFWATGLYFYLNGYEINLKQTLFIYLFSQLPVYLYEVYNVRPKFNYNLIVEYLVVSFKYGVLNTVVSLNSLVPRYFIMYFGDKKSLGIYTILHLFSSNFVNIMQYPLSIYCDKMNRRIGFDVGLKLILPIFLVFIMGFFLLSLDENYLTLFLFFVLVLVSFLIRGVFVTISVVRNVDLNFYMILSIVISYPLIYVLITLFQFNNFILLGCLYILFSNFIFMILSGKKVSGIYA